ncbi:chalcone isomerase family protein [Aquimarina muelleri]|nr:chalcone isomerase family protein [Aquimarina muelleri]MCX2763294.1 chalcone isomerase family protein [Aquimarina muelleri]
MKKISILLIVLITMLSAQAQTKVGDAILPNTIKFNGENLTINGAGLREKLFFDIYAGALYLKQKSNKASVAGLDETMAVRVHVLSGMMSRKKMEAALRNGFVKSTNNKTAPLQDRIEKFIGFVSEEIESGQIFDMVYEKGKGNVLYKNGVEKGFVEGLDFKKALFNIWLGNDPVDKGLKNEMLGN